MRLAPALRGMTWPVAWFAVTAGALVARLGTPASRAMSLGLLLVAVGVFAGLRYWLALRTRPSTKAAIEVVRASSPELALRLERATALLTYSGSLPEGSPGDLSQLHRQRLWQQVPLGDVEARGRLHALSFRWVSWILAGLTAASCAVVPYRVLEGMNVLGAKDHRAPYPMDFLLLDPATAQPPAYLRRHAQVFDFGVPVELPRGTWITVRGVARFQQRNLVLWDGKTDIPFVSDADGGLTARYQVLESTQLSVAARLGEVRIFQAGPLELTAVADTPPEVTLENVPERTELAKDLELLIRYRATDDHGIAQIGLELTSGSQKETRPLVKLDGQTRHFEGAYRLVADDAMVSQAVGPVELRVVALDGNEVDGAQSGQSRKVIVSPPAIGADLAARMQALEQLRDLVVDWYALAHDTPTDLTRQKQLRASVRKAADQVDAMLRSRGKGGARLRGFIRAQLDKLSPARLAGPSSLPTLSEVVLSIDAIASSLGQRDAEQVSRLLALVAGEIEQSAKEASTKEQRDALARVITQRLDQLRSGADQLTKLGALGEDLGQVAAAGTVRIARTADARDFVNVARAASFLAERLNRPTPSFVGGAVPGVESGGLGKGSGESFGQGSRPSESDTRLYRVLAEIAQLAADHRQVMDEVNQKVEGVAQAIDTAPGGDEDLRQAALLRQAVQSLPSVGGDPGTQAASAALAKEMVLGAAESLSQHQVGRTLTSLQKADSSLLEASKSAGELVVPKVDVQKLTRARTEIAAVRAWLERRLEQLMAQESAREKPAFQGLSSRERELSERAAAIASREAKIDGVLPDDIRKDLTQASRLLQQAGGALAAFDGTEAQLIQRRAQELLERATQSEEDGKGGEGRGASGHGGRMPTVSQAEGPVPSTGDPEARERFRKRVLEGLGGARTPESEALIRRYVEGLLR